ncbi:SCP2 sterol-binding domain-containing protein [Pseudidiomarina sp. 1APR75-15]|uniref:Ubiquinone biosynthesis accessory factor UbiJ n=1 Tax=Pseudidiomarina terrestris TaxID=2820060 RepID=A0ABT8MI09_9GAMM|nr:MULTISPECIES: SCP2 sterol-binding domain-containing protein [unclassified Pseudidiomarina]MDN7129583.1 SCP2 sterol-binding domain-containing protein [Pseudidiomarina sp. 1APR75-15]MEA3588063.1 SCP2 sterol-binding domain-containing protein [Pseudidiomarina sp. 1APP75-27a]
MLWTVLPTQVAEGFANHILSLDPHSNERLQKLAGRRLRLTLKELGRPFTLGVTESGIVFSWIDDQQVDCHIITELAVLPELRDSANITRLIKADKLDIEGDPMLAQQLSKLFSELDIDWAEQLSRRIGDVPAQVLVNAYGRGRKRMQRFQQDSGQWVKDALTEEKRVIPARERFIQFQQDVQALRARLDKLERHLKEQRN